MLGQSNIILETITAFDATQWQKPTALAGWDIFTLVAHILRAPDNILRYAANPLDVAPKLDWVSYWRFDGADMAGAISERARQSAAKTSPATLNQEFAQTLKAVGNLLDTTPATTVIQSVGGSITLADFVITRVVEMTIHTFDLANAVGQPPRLDPLAQSLTVATLEALLEKPRPPAFADDTTFILAATGRIASDIRLPAFR